MERFASAQLTFRDQQDEILANPNPISRRWRDKIVRFHLILLISSQNTGLWLRNAWTLSMRLPMIESIRGIPCINTPSVLIPPLFMTFAAGRRRPVLIPPLLMTIHQTRGGVLIHGIPLMFSAMVQN